MTISVLYILITTLNIRNFVILLFDKDSHKLATTSAVRAPFVVDEHLISSSDYLQIYLVRVALWLDIGAKKYSRLVFTAILYVITSRLFNHKAILPMLHAAPVVSRVP